MTYLSAFAHDGVAGKRTGVAMVVGVLLAAVLGPLFLGVPIEVGDRILGRPNLGVAGMLALGFVYAIVGFLPALIPATVGVVLFVPLWKLLDRWGLRDWWAAALLGLSAAIPGALLAVAFGELVYVPGVALWFALVGVPTGLVMWRIAYRKA